ncbi:hypothetical protein GCM10009001_02600 [Virgibacillus siamensis]|uniref:Uncharacterized protein n=1 Tax=Virgibacillus siamensis TaxID=480071 RepID=A0ABP3QFW6_9BACI
MNPVILHKKMSHEFQNKLNRRLTKQEDEFLEWMVNQKFREEDNRRNEQHLYQS